jgi:hypothetical protein
VSGFTPLLATALYGWTGWIGPALLISAYGLLGLLAALVTQETWGPAERAEVERLEREIEQERAQGKNIVPSGASWAHRATSDSTI